MSHFVHLHVYSDYSLLKGMNQVKDLALRASQLHMPAVALTDKGNMFGAMEFYTTILDQNKEANAQLKPIIGCELQVRRDTNCRSIVLLAKSPEGYRNLVKLNTQASKSRNKNGAPFVSIDDLEAHQKGLVALSGGMEGDINTQLVQGQETDETIDLYKSIFGAEHFYLELQNHHYKEQTKVNNLLLDASKRMGVPVVATNEVYYLNKEDASAHEVLLRIESKKEVTAIEREGRIKELSLPGEGYHFKTEEEMKKDFSAHPEALKNTLRIADMCDFELPKQEIHYPKYDLPEGETASSFLMRECKRQLASKNLASKPNYNERLDYELSVIDKMGFSTYFLVVADFVNAAKKNGIVVGPGRGSAVGSLVAFATGITNVDPIEYGLLFERFLNPERISLPDVDIDFQDNKREDIINYCKEKYGSRQMAQIVTYGKLKAKAVLKDVARVFGIDFGDANKLSALIGNAKSLEHAYKEQPAFKDAIVGNSALQNIYRYSLKLEGLTRQTGVHASGIIIADKPLEEYVPLTTDEDGNPLTQYEGKLLEDHCGLIKMDFLGLKTLSILEECVSLVRDNKGIQIDLNNLPLNDKKTYQMLSNGRSLGVFQFESAGMQKYLKELKPTSLDDLTALNAMYRPGPMEWIPVYTARKNNQSPQFSDPSKREDFKRLVKLLEKYECLQEIMGPTKGIPIYQEQIMEIGKNYAGFSMGRADTMRSAIGKKKTEQFGLLLKEFADGAKSKGYAEKDSHFLFKKVIEPFGGYGFNKSHAVCYALVAYQTAYLKANHKEEFMASLLNSEISNTTKIKRYVEESIQMGIRVLPPDINQSDVFFGLEGNAIRYSLNAIMHVGEGLSRSIVNSRKQIGTYKSFAQFIRSQGQAINKQALESLVKAGCFESFDAQPSELLKAYPTILESVLKEHNLKKGGQGTFFSSGTVSGSFDLPKDEGVGEQNPSNSKPDSEETLANYELSSLGFLLRHDRITQLLDVFHSKSPINFSTKNEWNDKQPFRAVLLLKEIRVIRTGEKQLEMAFLTLQNHTGTGDGVLFPDAYAKAKDTKKPNDEPLLSEGNLLQVQGKLQNNKGRLGLVVDSIQEFVPQSLGSLASPRVQQVPHSESTQQKDLNGREVVGSSKELCIEFAKKTITESECLDLKETLQGAHGGNCKVCLFVHSGDERRKIEADDLWVFHDADLISNLQSKPFVERVWMD